MKKCIVALILLLFCFHGAFAAENTEMVVLLDNSVSVLPIYDDLEQHLIGGILESHLTTGDRFHLITFADTPEIEVSKEIRGQKDLDDTLAYVRILQPMGQYTDLLLALMFLDTYVEDLSLVTRKKILILTDGIHDPPPDSPFYGLTEEMVRQRIEEFSRELRKKGWDFHILSLNGNTGRTGKPSYIDTMTQQLGIEPALYSGEEGTTLSHVALGIPGVVFPESLGEVDHEFDLPLEIRNFSGSTVLITITGVVCEGTNILRRENSITLEKDEQGTLVLKIRLPEDMEPGENELDLSLITPDDVTISPERGTVGIHLVSEGGKTHRGRVFLIILIAAAAAGLVFLIVRFFSSVFTGSHAAGQAVSGGAAAPGAGGKPGYAERAGGKTGGKPGVTKRPAGPYSPSSYRVKPGDRPLEMRVQGQNRFAGARNILNVEDGETRKVGGRQSSGFTIFIAPFPVEIATLERKGNVYSLHITDGSFFPGASGTIYNCVNRDIVLQAENGQEIIIRFYPWISPLEKINRILHLTDSPGLPDFDY